MNIGAAFPPHFQDVSIPEGVTEIPTSAFMECISLSQTSYTYDGKAKEPTVTVKDGSKTLVKNIDYIAVLSRIIKRQQALK